MTTPPDDLALGQWLKHHRAALGLTQYMLALRVGCTVSMLQKIERGMPRITFGAAERAAIRLGEPEPYPAHERPRRRPHSAVHRVPDRCDDGECDAQDAAGQSGG